MKKIDELGIGAFRPGGFNGGAHKIGMTPGPRTDADSGFSRSQQTLAPPLEEEELDNEEEENILECRVFRSGKFQLIETLELLKEEPKDDYRNMANKINRQARQKLNNIDSLESLEDKLEEKDDLDEMSGVAAIGGGPAVPVGYTAKGRPETRSQRKKRQRFNRQKSFPYS